VTLQICQLLNGFQMGQALAIVKSGVPSLLCEGHLIDTANPNFIELSDVVRHYARGTS